MTEDLKLHIKRWRWGNTPNKYQVGPMLFSREIQLDNYFIMKIYRKYITEDHFEEFYNYHLEHYRSSVESPNEQTHFMVIWEIIEGGITIQNRYPYSELAKKRKFKLKAFQQYLKSIDQWDHASTMGELVQLKNKEIHELNRQLDSVRKELSKLKVDYKIKINHVDRTSIFDVFLQMRDLVYTENDSRVFTDPAQSTWAKILANHFEDDHPIPFDTALNYFRGKSKIQDKHKLFTLK